MIKLITFQKRGVNAQLLPSLLIKLRLVKQFVKASSTEGPVSQNFLSMFPKLSKAKVEAVVGELFRNVVQGFLVNKRSPNYKIFCLTTCHSLQVHGMSRVLESGLFDLYLDLSLPISELLARSITTDFLKISLPWNVGIKDDWLPK